MNRRKKIAVTIGACLIVYAFIGFVIVPLVLESILPKKLSEALHRPVHIENISLNPFALTAAVEGLDIQDKNSTSPFVSFEELFVNIQTMSLFKLGLVMAEVRLTEPNIHIIRTAATEFNFSDLIAPKTPDVQEEAETPKEPAKPFHFSISNIAIINGNIFMQDDTVGENHILSAINLKLPKISNFEKDADTYSKPVFSADLNDTGITIDMETKPFHDTLATTIDLSLTGIEIPYYFAYVPKNMVEFKIQDGRLNVQSKILFRQTSDAKDLTIEGNIELAGLALTGTSGESFFTLPELKISVAPSHPLKNQLTLASVQIQSPEVSVTRDSNGIINLATLGPKKDIQPDSATPAPKGPVPDEASPDEPSADESSQAADSSKNPFIITINELGLDSGQILFSDHAAPEARAENGEPAEFSVDDLKIKLSQFSNASDKTATFDIHCLINKVADVAATGSLGVMPLMAESDFSLDKLALAWAQPYIPENIRLQITGGRFSTSGHARVSTPPEGNIQTAITGKAAVDEFASMDKDDNEPFISWKDFTFDGIDVTTNPVNIHLNEIQLTDFKNHIVVFKDGATNISKIFVKTPEATETSATKAAEPGSPASTPVIPIKIGEIKLNNFDVAFADKSVTPNFSTHMNLADLRVTGLTSENFQAADLNAEGKIDDYAPVKIKGSINPLKKAPFLDVTYSLSDMDLSPLSSYTGKYIGRTIEKGKLSTNVTYKIDDKKITAKNHLLLDQFTLGKKVASKDAIDLPVGVAIALLKDRNGRINIDLPISGRTDDPNFGIAKPLLKALKNLIVKAATSPFALVSSIVGGGEELRYIEFAPGTAAIDAASAKKLDTIKKLMYERPVLKMDLAGYVDPESDKEALAALMLTRKIKAQTLGKNAAKDTAAIDAVVLSPEAYQKLLKKMYIKDLLSDPEKKKALKPADDPTLTNNEMESALQKETPVTDNALSRLALDRAQAVKDYLLKDQSISPNRVFLTTPPALAPPEKKGFKMERVELNVR